jgi:hypothetical protein
MCMYSSEFSRYIEQPSSYEYPIFEANHLDGGEDKVFATGPATGFGFPTPVNALALSYEQISPPPTNVDRYVWKNFEHYKILRDQSGNNFRTNQPTAQYVTGLPNSDHLYHSVLHEDTMFGWLGFGIDDVGFPIAGLPVFRDESVSPGGSGFIPDPEHLNAYMQASLQTMLPTIKQELSAINSFVELPDVLSVKRTLELMKQFVLRPQAIDVKGKLATLSLLLKVIGDVKLQKDFNINPMISDVYGIYRALAAVEKRMNALVTSAGRVRHMHFARTYKMADDTDEASGVYNPVVYPGVYGECQSYRRVSYSPVKFHAEIEYNVNYTQYQREHARILTLLDSVGINFNPATIWKGIRWSFIVDWVAGVSQFLDQFKVLNMEPQINILRYLWSVKYERRIALSKTIGRSGIPYVRFQEQAPCGNYVETAYRRQVIRPTPSLIELGGLSLNEFSLGVALVLANRRTPRKIR